MKAGIKMQTHLKQEKKELQILDLNDRSKSYLRTKSLNYLDLQPNPGHSEIPIEQEEEITMFGERMNEGNLKKFKKVTSSRLQAKLCKLR